MSGTGGFLNPQAVLNELDIQAPSKIADFGCGHGYFTIPLARTVGKDGLIYAVDVLNEALAEVGERAKQQGLANIELIRGNLEVPGGSKVPENSCDMVLLANILFQSKKKADIITESRRVLKAGGRMVIVDWQISSPAFNQGSGWRISEDEVKQMATTQNFAFDRDFNAGACHYGLVFRKF